MFGLFKKKEKPAPVQVEIKYACIGPNLLEATEDKAGDNTDELKWMAFEKIKSKVFTKNEIEKVSDHFGFDASKGFNWIDYEILKADKGEQTIKVLQRFCGVKENELKENPELKALERHFNYKDFYTMVDIQKVAMKLHFDVYKLCDWDNYTVVEHSFSNGQTFTVQHYMEPKK